MFLIRRSASQARVGAAKVLHIVIKEILHIRETVFFAGPGGLKPATRWWDSVVGKRMGRGRVLKFTGFSIDRLVGPVRRAQMGFDSIRVTGGLQVGKSSGKRRT